MNSLSIPEIGEPYLRTVGLGCRSIGTAHCRLSGNCATIHWQVDSSDKAALGGSEEHGCRCKLIRCSKSPHWDHLSDPPSPYAECSVTAIQQIELPAAGIAQLQAEAHDEGYKFIE